jgi:phenylpropionate dioxygenase-like ring-hydroxylating dioxygenase large terminal subunit
MNAETRMPSVADGAAEGGAGHGSRIWPEGGLTRVPYWAYQDQAIYDLEQERIYRGPVWHYLCLEVELPGHGDFKTTHVGDMPVIVARDTDGSINAFENRCAHRGSLLALKNHGTVKDFTCVYHAWSHDLRGNLTGVAFRRGVNGRGGMPDSFTLEGKGPRKLRTAVYCGLVFGTLSEDTPPLEQWLGPQIRERMERVLCKPLAVLGSYTQVLNNNWKLYFENVRDSYHSSLLHLFFATFRISRMSQGGGLIVDESGGQHVSYSISHQGGRDDAYEQSGLRANKEDAFRLADASLLEIRDEFGDSCQVQILSIFPGFVLQEIHNSLVVRQVIPKGVGRTHLVWTHLGFKDDDAKLRALRLKHANLVGPAGYVSMEDGAVGNFVERGIAAAGAESSIVEMGGSGTETQDTRATEASIRGFWKAWRARMGI